MQTITLTNVLPHVFAARTDLKSEVWQQDVKFEKNKLYLVEAMSGTGKSTLCSYILGYRHDYTGKVMFDATDTKSISVSEWVNIRQRSISHLFQELRLFPELTALENVMIKNNLTNFKPVDEIKDWFERLGIGDKLNAKVAGRKCRICIFIFWVVRDWVAILREMDLRLCGLLEFGLFCIVESRF